MGPPYHHKSVTEPSSGATSTPIGGGYTP